jgi:hypothetical protein
MSDTSGSGFTPERILWEDVIEPGTHASLVLRRGTSLRLTDEEGGANVSALFYNAEQPLERYNMADTLKAQHTAFLTAGHVCFSDMGRVLVSITEDTCGWHDTICGTTNAALARERWGERGYQEHRNAMVRNGRDSLLVELGKYGLGRKDMVPNVNFFSRVAVDDAGDMTFLPGNSKPGDHVDLRAEMDVLVALSGTPHPMDPSPEYAPKRVRMTIWKSDPPGPDDPCRTHCPENARGFVNTERLYMGL